MGVTSSILEDDSAAVMLQSALGRFFCFYEFLSLQDKSVRPCGFHIHLHL
jgi:hypothetical protein